MKKIGASHLLTVALVLQLFGCAGGETLDPGMGAMGAAGVGGTSGNSGRPGSTGVAGSVSAGTAGTGGGAGTPVGTGGDGGRGGSVGTSGAGGGRGGSVGTSGAGGGGTAGASGGGGSAGAGGSSPCNPLTNAGCATGTKCTVLQTPTTFALGCGSKGSKAAGATCTQAISGQMQTGDDCADGMACFAVQGESTPTCRQFCMASGATGACPTATTCNLQITNLPGASFCRATTSCTLLPQTGCPSAQGCYLTPTGSTCAPAGTAAPGATCASANDCAPGSTCITTGGASSCASFCSLTAGGTPGCAATGTGGTTCMPTPGTPPEPNTGVCR